MFPQSGTRGDIGGHGGSDGDYNGSGDGDPCCRLLKGLIIDHKRLHPCFSEVLSHHDTGLDCLQPIEHHQI